MTTKPKGARPDTRNLSRDQAVAVLVNGGWEKSIDSALAIVEQEQRLNSPRPDTRNLSRESAANELRSWYPTLEDAYAAVDRERAQEALNALDPIQAAIRKADATSGTVAHAMGGKVPRVVAELVPIERELNTQREKLKSEIAQVEKKLAVARSRAAGIVNSRGAFAEQIERAKRSLEEAKNLLARLEKKRAAALEDVTRKVRQATPSEESVLRHADKVASFDVGIRAAKKECEERKKALDAEEAKGAEFEKAHAKDLELVTP